MRRLCHGQVGKIYCLSYSANASCPERGSCFPDITARLSTTWRFLITMLYPGKVMRVWNDDNKKKASRWRCFLFTALSGILCVWVLFFYSLIRHPMYLSTLLLFPAMPVVLRAVIFCIRVKKCLTFAYSCCCIFLLFPCASAMELALQKIINTVRGGMHICGEEEALEERLADIRSVNRRSDIRRYRLSGESATSMINTVFR